MKHISAVVVVIFGAIYSVGQNPSASAGSSVPVFHAQSRLVIVDVVATNRKGKVVVGLKASDFKVSEAGVPQQIRFFEEHASLHPRSRGTLPKLPPHQYTNFPADSPAETMNIVLLDLMNTEPAELNYARKEMLKALVNLPKGHQMALFVLNGDLQMLQAPSGDTEKLIEAAKKLIASPSRVVKGHEEAAYEEHEITALENNMGSGGHGSPGSSAGNGDTTAEQLRTALFKEQAQFTDTRVGTTLAALEALARMVAGYPGRKNLIWISAGIPFRIRPDSKGGDRYKLWREKRDYTMELDRAATMLADAQIAIYPVDVGSLAILGVGASVSGSDFSASGSNYRNSLNDQQDQNWDNHVAMTDLAEQTGGHAFLGSNDLAGAITNGIEKGSRYYTIAYAPSNQKWNGGYRPIRIESTGADLVLEYRKGYIASAEKIPDNESATRILASAMQLGMPPSTSLLMRVQVLPPDSEHKNVRIDYAVASDEIRFSEAEDHSKRATLDLMTVAWNDKSILAGTTSNTMETTLKANTPADALKTGVPAHQELALETGHYILCVGVMDRASQKVGTVWVPLVVGEEAGK